MLARYLNAPLLLLIWQVAPVPSRPDEGGPVRLSFGAGNGAFAFDNYPGYPGGMNCGGTYPGRSAYTQDKGYASKGGSAEIWIRRDIRIWTAIGSISDNSLERGGTFGAVKMALEKDKFGIGLGFATLGGLERVVQPSASVRYGSLNRFSVRAEYRQPVAGMGLAGGPRIGIGWNQGRGRKTRFLFGISTTPIPDTLRRVGGFAELAVPLGFLSHKGGFMLNGFLSGSYHGNEAKQIGSFLLGAWLEP
jgi:hypothetical protein